MSKPDIYPRVTPFGLMMTVLATILFSVGLLKVMSPQDQVAVTPETPLAPTPVARVRVHLIDPMGREVRVVEADNRSVYHYGSYGFLQVGRLVWVGSYEIEPIK